jgi:uncharacterized protein (TIGR03083 family)
MNEHAIAYKQARERFTGLVSDLAPEALNEKVPACPDWSVKDLTAHVVGIARDLNRSNVDDPGDDAWTAAQIAEGERKTLEELLDEWAGYSTEIEKAMEFMHPAISGVTTADLIVHEHDLRGAIGEPGARDSSGVSLALFTYTRMLGRRLKEQSAPPLRIMAGGETYDVGDGAPDTSVSGEPFEIFRSLCGRRTKEEIEGLNWEGDPAPFLGRFSNYGYPDHSLNE